MPKAKFGNGFLVNTVLIAVATIPLLIAYASLLSFLPIFGDATSHASIARSMLEKGIWDTASPYPPLYSVLGALALAIGGEMGFKFIVLLGLFGLGVVSFFLGRALTGSRWVGAVTAFLVLASPKTLFYGSRMYMEILLSAIMLAAILFLVLYVQKNRMSYLVFASLFAGVAALTKQLGLLVLLPSMAAFLSIMVLRRRWMGGAQIGWKASFRPLLLFVAIAGVLATLGVAWQIRMTGSIIPNPFDDPMITPINAFGRSLVGYQEQELPAWQIRWDSYLDDSAQRNGYFERGFIRPESRHIWPWDVFLSFDKSLAIHSLLPASWVGTNYNKGLGILYYPITGLFFLGALIWVIQQRRNSLLLFLGIFLALNYAAFIRSNDQLRYHVYISYMLAFLYPFPVYWMSRNLAIRWRQLVRATLTVLASLVSLARRFPRLILLALATLMFLAYVLNYFGAELTRWRGWVRTQAYSSSVGGMPSLIEVSRWVRDNSNPDDIMYAVPNNEYSYYAERNVIFEPRVYFLEKEVLSSVFRDMGIRYILMAQASVRPDAEWTSITVMPRSFERKVDDLYRVAYQSSYKDITVYNARAPKIHDVNTLLVSAGCRSGEARPQASNAGDQATDAEIACFLGQRPDILEFYRLSNWNISPDNLRAIFEDWWIITNERTK